MSTSNEKLKIATHFILSSPHGELRDVILDVKNIVADNKLLNNNLIDNLQKQYHVDHMNYAKKNDQTVIICEAGKVDDSHFLNPNNNLVYQVNYDTLEIVGNGTKSNNSIESSLEEYRKAIEAAVNFYAESYYGSDKYSAACYGKNGIITIIISSRNVHLNAMWSGGWTSTYVLPIKQGVADMKVSIKLNVHYFEDGNVQLNTNFGKECSIRVENVENTAKAVATSMEKIESEFHKQLEEFYVNMNQSTFKAMRRFLPPSRKTFEWNSNAHKLASDLMK